MEQAIYSARRAQSKTLNFADPPIADRFTELQRVWDRRDRRWLLLACVNGREVEVTGDQLLDYPAFRAAALEQQGLYLPRVSEEEWEELVRLRVEETGGEWTV